MFAVFVSISFIHNEIVDSIISVSLGHKKSHGTKSYFLIQWVLSNSE